MTKNILFPEVIYKGFLKKTDKALWRNVVVYIMFMMDAHVQWYFTESWESR